MNSNFHQQSMWHHKDDTGLHGARRAFDLSRANTAAIADLQEEPIATRMLLLPESIPIRSLSNPLISELIQSGLDYPPSLVSVEIFWMDAIFILLAKAMEEVNRCVAVSPDFDQAALLRMELRASIAADIIQIIPCIDLPIDYVNMTPRQAWRDYVCLENCAEADCMKRFLRHHLVRLLLHATTSSEVGAQYKAAVMGAYAVGSAIVLGVKRSSRDSTPKAAIRELIAEIDRRILRICLSEEERNVLLREREVGIPEAKKMQFSASFLPPPPKPEECVYEPFQPGKSYGSGGGGSSWDRSLEYSGGLPGSGRRN